MKAKYLEIMAELDYITTDEGFVTTCLDLKDSMYFYDKALVLAGYASSVEMLMSLAMFWVTLEDPHAQDEVFDEIASIIDNLHDRLEDDGASMDIASLSEAFLQSSAWVLQQRYLVFRSMFLAYGQNGYDLKESTDQLLYKIQLCIDEEGESATRLMGKVGAMALRGVEIRPVWFLVAGPRLLMWLRGILGAIQSFLTAAHFSFPVDTVELERQKWRGDGQRLVVDLKAFRNLRYPMLPWDNPDILRKGEIEDELLELFSDGILDDGALANLVSGESTIDYALLAILQADALSLEGAPGGGWAPVNALKVLRAKGHPGVIPALLGLLGKLNPGQLLYSPMMNCLWEEGEPAVKMALERLEEPGLSVGGALPLISFINQVHPSGALPALTRLMDRAETVEDRLAIARSLLHAGDIRVIPHLRRLGDSLSSTPYGAAVREFVDVATLHIRAKQRQRRRR